MEMYNEYCTSAVPTETLQQRHKMKQQGSPSTSQTQQTPSQEMIPKDVHNRRDQTNQDLEAEETSIKEGIDRRPSTLTSSATLGMDTMSSTLPIRPSDHQCSQILMLEQQQKALEVEGPYPKEGCLL